MKAKELLKKHNACNEAIEWAGDKTIQEAWDTCKRGDWMLWIYKKLYPKNIRQLTIAKGYCANTVRHLLKDERSLKAIDASIDFGNYLIDENELEIISIAADAAAIAADAVAYAAAYAADAAADAADYAAADAAAYAAAYAAADAAAYAAADAVAYADYAYAAAAADYAYATTKKQNQKQTADICRKYLKLEF